jgi:ubiquinone biosynthesis protein UbiJ
MPFDPLVTASVETILNRLIQDDPALVRQLARLKGKVIQVHLKEFDKALTFVFSQQVDVLACYEGQPDCFLSLTISTLPQLREPANITQLIKQEQLALEGDVQLAQKFAQLMTDCQPDWEEWLSRLTGDIVAHTVARGVKDLGEWIHHRHRRHQAHLAQVLTEEWQIAPGSLEIADFCDQVDEVKSFLGRLEIRVQSLAEKI